MDRARSRAASPVPGRSPVGVEEATRRHLEGLSEVDSPLGQIALSLARAIDDGAEDKEPAFAKELRATLKELTPRDGGDAFADLLAELSSAPVRDTSTT